ncbi:hypothetical protein D3C73_1259650 [compost metagenome]
MNCHVQNVKANQDRCKHRQMNDSQPVLLMPVNVEDQCCRGKVEQHGAEKQIHHQPVMKLVQEQQLD